MGVKAYSGRIEAGFNALLHNFHKSLIYVGICNGVGGVKEQEIYSRALQHLKLLGKHPFVGGIIISLRASSFLGRAHLGIL